MLPVRNANRRKCGSQATLADAEGSNAIPAPRLTFIVIRNNNYHMSGNEGSGDASHGAEAFMRAGMSELEAARKTSLMHRCGQALREMGADGEPWRFFVPGRIEVLGKHTDYAGGRSLLMAAERGLCAAAAGRPDGILRLLSADDGRTAEFLIGPDLEPSPGLWSNYPMTVARRIARNFAGPLRGADVAFASDLPPAAGMSSSSAMVVLTFLILDAASQLCRREEYQRNIPSAEALGEYLGCVENGQSYGPLAGDQGVGTFGGSEDHTAILCCRPDQLSQYSFCPVELERTIAFPPGHLMVVGVSGVAAEKTGEAQEKYNRVSRLTGEIVRLWGKRRRHTEHSGPRSLTLASAVRAAGFDEVSRVLQAGTDMFGGEEMRARLEQFARESERIIPEAGDALARDDLDAWGLLVDESQKLAEMALGNQVPETIFLARAARDLGAAAASAFGAGFGGSVWAMVNAAEAEVFAGRWSAVYRQTFPQHAGRADFFTTRAGPGAMRLE